MGVDATRQGSRIGSKGVRLPVQQPVCLTPSLSKHLADKAACSPLLTQATQRAKLSGLFHNLRFPGLPRGQWPRSARI